MSHVAGNTRTGCRAGHCPRGATLIDQAGILERAKRHGWRLVVLDLGLDPSTAAGELELCQLGDDAALATRRARTASAVDAISCSTCARCSNMSGAQGTFLEDADRGDLVG